MYDGYIKRRGRLRGRFFRLDLHVYPHSILHSLLYPTYRPRGIYCTLILSRLRPSARKGKNGAARDDIRPRVPHGADFVDREVGVAGGRECFGSVVSGFVVF